MRERIKSYWQTLRAEWAWGVYFIGQGVFAAIFKLKGWQ